MDRRLPRRKLAIAIAALVVAVPGLSACGFNYATDREDINEKVYGPDHPELARPLLNLGLARHDLGEDAAATKLFERALAILRAHCDTTPVAADRHARPAPDRSG